MTIKTNLSTGIRNSNVATANGAVNDYDYDKHTKALGAHRNQGKAKFDFDLATSDLESVSATALADGTPYHYMQSKAANYHYLSIGLAQPLTPDHVAYVDLLAPFESFESISNSKARNFYGMQLIVREGLNYLAQAHRSMPGAGRPSRATVLGGSTIQMAFAMDLDKDFMYVEHKGLLKQRVLDMYDEARFRLGAGSALIDFRSKSMDMRCLADIDSHGLGCKYIDDIGWAQFAACSRRSIKSASEYAAALVGISQAVSRAGHLWADFVTNDSQSISHILDVNVSDFKQCSGGVHARTLEAAIKLIDATNIALSETQWGMELRLVIEQARLKAVLSATNNQSAVKAMKI